MRTVFIALLAGVAMGLFLAPRTFTLRHGSKPAETLSQKMQSVMELVQDEYVDAIDGDSAVVNMMNAIMTSLDPHSRYIAAEDLKREVSDMRGNFEGIGATLRSDHDTVYVGQTLQKSPARAAGLRPGDRIITVDNDTVSGVKMPIDEVIKRIRGPHGVPVTLGIMHYDGTAVHRVKVGRDVIPTNSVAYSGLLDPQTGYVRLTRFSETSYREVLDAMEALEEQGMKALVLDLRGNGGGLLDAAIRIANEFLHRGDLIVYTQGEHQRRKDVRADGNGSFQDTRLFIMIDEFSASASEVVSGAIQDNDRGTIVGRRSFGKGLVQQQFDFSDGSAVWLTVARYYTPSGRCIQRPYDKGTDEYYAEFLNELMAESGADSTLAKITDSTPYHTTKGRIVYGGGGIYPDHVIAYQHDSLIVYYNQLTNHRILERTAYDYVAQHYDELLRNYPDEKAFSTRYVIEPALHDKAIEAGRKSGIAVNENSLAKYSHRIDTMMKAYMAEYLYSLEAFYSVYLDMDSELQTTLKLMHKAK
ncbi:MAG: S41 family peptidase [Bacteroidales bacterium]|nr:S41 family peptidase [Bacteroidales bacterium]